MPITLNFSSFKTANTFKNLIIQTEAPGGEVVSQTTFDLDQMSGLPDSHRPNPRLDILPELILPIIQPLKLLWL